MRNEGGSAIHNAHTSQIPLYLIQNHPREKIPHSAYRLNKNAGLLTIAQAKS
jgi:hypothetical protein